jgi:hypothetical protein
MPQVNIWSRSPVSNRANRKRSRKARMIRGQIIICEINDTPATRV